jgi:hypothetical protein
MFEERAAKLAELNYVRQIDNQKDTNTQILQALKSQGFQ